MKGDRMNITLTELALIAIAAAAWVYVLFGANLI
jgi:hypothetical protein